MQSPNHGAGISEGTALKLLWGGTTNGRTRLQTLCVDFGMCQSEPQKQQPETTREMVDGDEAREHPDGEHCASEGCNHSKSDRIRSRQDVECAENNSDER